MSQNCNECPICLGNARLPVATKCGHIYCWQCIKSWVNVKGKQECPACKNGIKLDEVVKLYTGDNQARDGEIDDRPKSERIKAEYVQPNPFKRFLNNFGVYGYTHDNSLRPPSQKDVERNILSLVILIAGILFIVYIFN